MNGDEFDVKPEIAADDAVVPKEVPAPSVSESLPGAVSAAGVEPEPEEEEDADGFTHEGQIEYEQDDPLAPAFDLDEGTPLTRSKGALPARNNVKSAKEFFNGEILYRFEILEDEARVELRGKYRIELKGFQGGIWTVEVGDQLEIVNRRDEAEIVLTMQQRDFLQLVNGELNPQLAVFAQKMRISGDLRKAVAFQALLSPEGE